MPNRLRCAIYTRKSTDEGLDQSFNSLDAQRDACSAFVRSQAHEGWSEVKTAYDDGGYSGGSMARPAITQLLADIEAKRIDVIVVYKVDRLTRSLADFARIVEILDRTGASFVSVTQSFNTTTSMGRLTLNVLLSFAQFEREVTGERIRDKIAASKAKGIWMGGVPPLGYDIKDRALIVNEEEAGLVRHIYRRYLALGSGFQLARELDRDAKRTKCWTSRAGRTIGGCHFSQGAINHILKARVYRGEIEHKGKIHQGAHQAIIDADTWDGVQARLLANTPYNPETQSPSQAHLLTGLIFDDAGNRMSPTHAKRRGRRYHYYTSAAHAHDRRGAPGTIARAPAQFVDDAVVAGVSACLLPAWRERDNRPTRVRAALDRVVVHPRGIVALVHRDAVVGGNDDGNGDTIEIRVSEPLRRRGGTIVIDAKSAASPPKLSLPLTRAIVLARRWADQLASGEASSVREIARQHGLCHLYVGKLLPLAFLAPDLVRSVLDGRHPRGLSISNLLAEPLPFSWADQRARFNNG